MYSALLAAGAGVASAVQATCTTDIVITSPTPTIECDVVDANIRVDPAVNGDLVIEGPKQIKGDLIIANATSLISISSNSINSIQGTFSMINLELLSSLNLASLNSLSGLTLTKLPQLSSLSFSPSGITKANDILIQDTFLSNLDGLNIVEVDSFVVTNNRKLTKIDSGLTNITSLLAVNNNGPQMSITMSRLQSAAEIQLSNIQTFVVPVLGRVLDSLKFDQNPDLKIFTADNLTTIGESMTFINNKMLTNVSFPVLTRVGDFTIQNNTALEILNGYPKLETITGGAIVGGSFKEVELPQLKDVKGGMTVTSTTDIADFCQFFDDLKSHGAIQGSEKCTSNNAKANEGGEGGTTGHGSSGSGNSTSGSSAVGSSASQMALVLGLTVLAGIAQLL
ncbi:Meiotic expression up-regulated protein 10 [Escovopsis weberi]|uniref:Meiotic expression up-regulated protein 10 n=1 Tax=Escovopsis weberi TaxID=150374 RepID=A0A0N0RTY7_ESCWE|nr:Meiotic expression up-regulated protein 10 [Escovopsis weberi]